MPAVMYLMVGLDGNQYGPAPMEKLVTWAGQGAMTPSTMITNLETGEKLAASQMPELMAAIPAGDLYSRPPQPSTARSTGTKMIPTANPTALIGYYMAIVSLIPCLGLLLGPTAVVLGSLGLSKYRRDPSVYGLAHSWVGIILGSTTTLANIALIVIGVVTSRR